MANAYKKYRKLRPATSRQASIRAKEFPSSFGVHPAFLQVIVSRKSLQMAEEAENEDVKGDVKKELHKHWQLERERIQYTQQLKRFRPAGEIFNKNALAKGRLLPDQQINNQNQNEDIDEIGEETEETEVARKSVKLAQQFGDEIIQKGRFKDKEFFVSSIKEDQLYQDQSYSVNEGGVTGCFADAVMDLTGNREQAKQAQGKRFGWDKKKSRFIQLQPNEVVVGGKRKMLNNASQHENSKDVGKAYQKWKKMYKMEIGVDETQADGSREKLQKLQGRFRQGGRGWVNPLKQHTEEVKGGEKLRTQEQVRKIRKIKRKNQVRHQAGLERSRQKATRQSGKDRRSQRSNKLKGVSKPSKSNRKVGKRKR
eukprot:TRINITY_DN11856_c0_g2_i2.p2 TRINITY_DN11856_c0_g2~~TRINITY_DN11856_c0_g2_i2.p2  ORF type:complete len:429 (+),score=92.46 TRINITY_DN11856_c0_g2_i2:185-1288(+)